MQTYKKRIYVETEYLGANVSCIHTEKGLVLIDSPFLPEDAKAWAELIRERTGRDIAFQINTDHHFDHVMGNDFLTDKIICHSTAAKGIKFLRDKKELKNIIRASFPDILDSIETEIDDLRIPSPHITFDRKLTLDMADATIILEFVGGHSPGTILVYLPEDKVVFTGDNVEGQFPYFGQGQFYVWKEILKKILSMDIELVVPGHGPVGGKEMVERYLSFFQNMEEEVKNFKLQGVMIEQMTQKSKTIHFFPVDETADEGQDPSWLEQQYRFAAKQILASTGSSPQK